MTHKQLLVSGRQVDTIEVSASEPGTGRVYVKPSLQYFGKVGVVTLGCSPGLNFDSGTFPPYNINLCD